MKLNRQKKHTLIIALITLLFLITGMSLGALKYRHDEQAKLALQAKAEEQELQKEKEAAKAAKAEEQEIKKAEEDAKKASTDASGQKSSEKEEDDTASTGSSHVVCLDPGHQRQGNSGTEPIGPGSSTQKAKVTGGAHGNTSGLYEYELVLDIGLKLKSELESRGYTVCMTRTSHDVDISNRERAEIAAKNGAEIMVRIHADGSESASANGASALVPSSSNPYVASLAQESSRLGSAIINAYTTACGMKNRGLQERDDMTGINWCTMPVTILEMGFMSNPSDDASMADPSYQKKMVEGIANGIDDYFK